MATANDTPFDSAIEEWRDIPDYEGLYQISNHGRFRGMPRNDAINRRLPERYIQPNKRTDGYYTIHLWRGGKRQQKKMHVLVMLVFVGQRPEGAHINHIDGNPSNNRLDNLEYCSPSDNTLHGFRIGTHVPARGEKHGRSRYTNDMVREMRVLYKGGASSGEIAKKFNVSRSGVYRVVMYDTWKHLE